MEKTFIEWLAKKRSQQLVEARTIPQRFKLKQHRLKGTAQQYSTMGVSKAYKRTRVFSAIRVMEAGRGWHAQRYYVLPEKQPVVVQIMTDGWSDDELVEVKIISGGDQPARRWAKRPYVSKKTGKRNPNVHLGSWIDDYMPNLENQYGLLGGRALVFKKDLV